MQTDKLNEYISSLQIPSTTETKIRETLAFYRDHDLLTPEDIFIGQEKDAEGNLRPTRLWLFTSTACAEADITNDKIFADVAAYKSRIRRFEIVASDSEFDDKELSRFLKIDVQIMGGLVCLFQAFGANRTVLWEIFLKHIKPNLAGA